MKLTFLPVIALGLVTFSQAHAFEFEGRSADGSKCSVSYSIEGEKLTGFTAHGNGTEYEILSENGSSYGPKSKQGFVQIDAIDALSITDNLFSEGQSASVSKWVVGIRTTQIISAQPSFEAPSSINAKIKMKAAAVVSMGAKELDCSNLKKTK